MKKINEKIVYSLFGEFGYLFFDNDSRNRAFQIFNSKGFEQKPLPPNLQLNTTTLIFGLPKKFIDVIVWPNRIDISCAIKHHPFDNLIEIFDMVFEILGDRKGNRLAINYSYYIEDNDDKLKTYINGRVYQSATENSHIVSELTFKNNIVVSRGDNELNCLTTLQDGLVQELVVSGNSVFPKIIKVLNVLYDVNTSLKNSLERFNKQKTIEVFKMLEDEKICLISIVDKMFDDYEA